MDTKVMMKRHPMTAVALALASMIAAGCTSDRDVDRRFGDASMAAVRGPFSQQQQQPQQPQQQQVAGFLADSTQNDPNVPLVFFCGGPQCWMSYNAALRAIALGYRNVLWYRGGLEAWNHAQLPFTRRADSSNRNDRG